MIRYCVYFRQTGLKILMALLLTVAYPAPDVAALTATIDVSSVSELRQAIDIANASTNTLSGWRREPMPWQARRTTIRMLSEIWIFILPAQWSS